MTERKSDQARYSRVTRRIWVDEKFRALSAPLPNGRDCWLRLLTAPEQGPIPGLFQAWPAGIAQSLGWSAEAFTEALGEVLAKALAKVDERVGLWWLPNALRHNEPESPNVVRGWRRHWLELPDSPLKDEAGAALLEHMRQRGAAWERAFLEVLGEVSPSVTSTPKASPKASAKPSRKASPKASSKALANPSPKPLANQDPDPDPDPDLDPDPEDETQILKTCQVSAREPAPEGSAASAASVPSIREAKPEAPNGATEPPRSERFQTTHGGQGVPTPEAQQGPVPARQTANQNRGPSTLAEALTLDITTRAQALERDQHMAMWLEPHRWPEVVEVAKAWDANRLGSYQRDSGVKALVALFASGYSVEELLRVSASLQRSQWAQEQRAAGRPIGIASMSPEVVRREIEAQKPAVLSFTELVKARAREEERARRKAAANVC